MDKPPHGYNCKGFKTLISDFCFNLWDKNLKKPPCNQYFQCENEKPTTTQISPTTTSVPESSLDIAWIIGIIVACLVAGAVLVGLGWFLFKKYRCCTLRYRNIRPDGTEHRLSVMLENAIDGNEIEL